MLLVGLKTVGRAQECFLFGYRNCGMRAGVFAWSGHMLNISMWEPALAIEKVESWQECETPSDAKQKKNLFFLIKKVFFFKTSSQKNVFLCFFIIIYNLKVGRCFLILWSAYSCYIQVVKHYIQYVNCIFIDSETNYLMN